VSYVDRMLRHLGLWQNARHIRNIAIAVDRKLRLIVA